MASLSSSTSSSSSSSSSSSFPSMPSSLFSWLERGWNWIDDPTISDSAPNFYDLLYVPFLIFLLHRMRKLVEQHVAIPLSQRLKIPPRKERSISMLHPALETLFISKDKSDVAIGKVSMATNLPVRKIQFWLRRRQKVADAASKPQLIDKFKDTACHFFFESLMLIYGLGALWSKPWAWALSECWRGWPTQTRELSIRWYYILQMGACSLSLITHFADVRRKDFWQMFVHHIVTLSLIFGSWITNTIRIGSLILVIHDLVDPVLQATKMAAYSKSEPLSTILFTLFAFLWFSTRLVLFPLRIIHSCLNDRVDIFEEQGVIDERLETLFRIGIGCLWVLYILHWIWFYSIITLIVKVAKGEKVKDTRSEDEGGEEEEEEEAGENKTKDEKGERGREEKEEVVMETMDETGTRLENVEADSEEKKNV